MKDKADVTEIVELVEAREKLKQEAIDINKRINALSDLIEHKCPHPVIKKKSKYQRGGYDYVSSVTITETCAICGMVMKSYDDPNHKGTHA